MVSSSVNTSYQTILPPTLLAFHGLQMCACDNWTTNQCVATFHALLFNNTHVSSINAVAQCGTSQMSVWVICDIDYFTLKAMF